MRAPLPRLISPLCHQRRRKGRGETEDGREDDGDELAEGGGEPAEGEGGFAVRSSESESLAGEGVLMEETYLSTGETLM